MVRTFSLALAAAAVFPAHRASPAPALHGVVLRQVEISPGMDALIEKERSIFIAVASAPGEGYRGLAARTTGDESNERLLTECNADSAPLPGKKYLVPFRYGTPALQADAARALFPDDRFEAGWYVHVVGTGTAVNKGESLWNIALWFTGEGSNFDRLARVNGLSRTRLEKGQRIRVPLQLLLPAFKPEAPVEIVNPPELSFEEAGGRAVAAYRLKKGEALYSSVVMRFCGLTDADDVNEAAAAISLLSGVADPSCIPEGQRILIPVELLSPEYRSRTDPRRVEYERSRRAPMRFQRKVATTNLEGVHILLDSGHGGIDTGARNGKICEDEYTYDILCRVRELLLKKTHADVVPLIRDTRTGHRPRVTPLLPGDRNENLSCTPPYALTSSRVGVNLRWYLANYHYEKWRSAGVAEGKIVFLSFHADARHAAIRGAMVYVAAEELGVESCSIRSVVYTVREEVQACPVAYFPKARRIESEGLSTALAMELVRGLGDGGVLVQEEKPLRPYVIRKRQAWVPGVLNFNMVPTKVLVEVCNMNNADDVALLVRSQYREKVAEGVVAALEAHFAPASDMAGRAPGPAP